MASKVIKPHPARYENVQVNGVTGNSGVGGVSDKTSRQKPHPLVSRMSDPAIKVKGSATKTAESASSSSSRANTTSSADSAKKSEHAVREAKFKLLIPVGSERGGECSQCKELSQLLSLWELGVGGIARNCSKILAQLNQARDAHQALECRLQEKFAEREDNTTPAPIVTKSLTVSRAQKVNFRKSLYSPDQGNSSSSGNSYVTEQMYPKKASSPGVPNSNSSECVSLPYDHYLTVLHTHLEQAIDQCQQLAAACFKSNQSVSTNSISNTPRLRRQPTAPTIKSPALPKSTSQSSTLTSVCPPLQAVVEEKPLKAQHRLSNVIRATSSPGLFPPEEEEELKSAGSDSDLQNPSRENHRLAKKMISSSELEDGWVSVATNGTTSPDKTDEVVPTVEGESSRSPYHNPVLSVLGITEKKKLEKEAQKSEREDLSELVLSSSSCASDNVRDSILSTYSDSDVKQVMSKIAGLEEERIRLLDTIDKLHKDNQLVS